MVSGVFHPTVPGQRTYASLKEAPRIVCSKASMSLSGLTRWGKDCRTWLVCSKKASMGRLARGNDCRTRPAVHGQLAASRSSEGRGMMDLVARGLAVVPTQSVAPQALEEYASEMRVCIAVSHPLLRQPAPYCYSCCLEEVAEKLVPQPSEGDCLVRQFCGA